MKQWQKFDNNRLVELCALLASTTNDAIDVMIDVELERLSALADMMSNEVTDKEKKNDADEPEIE